MVRQWLDTHDKAAFKELRQQRPIMQTEKATLVTRFDDCIEILRQPTTFSVALYQPKMGDFMLSQDDIPSRFRDKGVMHAMLNRDDLPGVRKMIGEAAAQALSAADGEIEAVWHLGRGVPIKLVQDYFGMQGAEPEKLFEWSYWNQMDAFHNQPFDINKDTAAIVQKRETALEEMKAFIIQLIQRRIGEFRQGATPDDVASRVLRTQFPDGVGFTMERAVINIGGLLIGAVETTSQAVIQAAAYLLASEEKASAAAAATTGPDDFDGYVWEALRFHPISAYMFRTAEVDYVLARGTDRETLIPKGTNVLPVVGSAMFDPHAFPDPDRFDANRPLHNTFHLGWGHHECLGKYVALVMIPEIVRQILLCRDVHAPEPVDYRGGPFPESWTLRWTT